MCADRRHWTLTDHACRVCFGRVLEHRADDGQRVYRCSNCGIEAAGKSPAVVCSCGLKLRTGVDAWVRCVVNDTPSPEMPSQIVAEQFSPGAAPR